MKGITEYLTDDSVQSGDGLCDAYERAITAASEKGFDYLLILEDDEALPEDAALRFQEVAEETDNTIYGAVKSLRCKPPVHTPWRWIWMHPDNSPLGHPINDGVARIEQIYPSPIRSVKIRGGIITSPMFVNVEWFRGRGLRFRQETERHFAGMLNGWDTTLSKDLDWKQLHFWACPFISAKHYDEQRQEIIT